VSKESNLTGFVIKKVHISEKANNQIEAYRKEIEQAGGTISKAMAAIKIIEKYADMIAEDKLTND
jgi:uncharacterized protein YbaA (DUF1428 family)